jgi:DNA-binding CsgD family transcriptional regulator
LGEEWVFPVAGMPLDCGTESASALFVRHALRSNPAFNGEASAGEIRELCQAVDGLPLAVELSAAWVRILSPGEILSRIRQDVGFLAANQPDRPERQRSLKAVFEYSWSLLSNGAQQSLCGISVFRGPFHVKLASEVAGCTLATLAELIDFALVIRLPDGRYQIHPLLRQFSAEKLDEATMSIPTYRAHAEAFSRYLVEHTHLLAVGDVETLAEMTPAFEDVRAAVKWLIWSQQINVVKHLLAPLAHLCRFSGYVVDGVALIGQIELWSRQHGAIDISQHARVLRESLESAPSPRYLELTKREAEILKLMAEGLSNIQIAEVLTVEMSTVKKHVNNLFRKLNVTGREDAVLVAQRTATTLRDSSKQKSK